MRFLVCIGSPAWLIARESTWCWLRTIFERRLCCGEEEVKMGHFSAAICYQHTSLKRKCAFDFSQDGGVKMEDASAAISYQHASLMKDGDSICSRNLI